MIDLHAMVRDPITDFVYRSNAIKHLDYQPFAKPEDWTIIMPLDSSATGRE